MASIIAEEKKSRRSLVADWLPVEAAPETAFRIAEVVTAVGGKM